MQVAGLGSKEKTVRFIIHFISLLQINLFRLTGTSFSIIPVIVECYYIDCHAQTIDFLYRSPIVPCAQKITIIIKRQNLLLRTAVQKKSNIQPTNSSLNYRTSRQQTPIDDFNMDDYNIYKTLIPRLFRQSNTYIGTNELLQYFISIILLKPIRALIKMQKRLQLSQISRESYTYF